MRSRRGLALVTVLLFISLIVMVTAAVGGRIRFTLGNAVHQDQVLQARYAAGAGLQRCLDKLALNPNWQPSADYQDDLDGEVGFRVQVVNNFAGTTPLAASNRHPTVPPARVYLQATGLVNHKALAAGFGQAEALAAKPKPIFSHALHSTGTFLNLNASNIRVRTDSYDSTSGYQPPPGYTPTVTASVRSEKGIDARGSYVDGHAVLPRSDVNLEQDSNSFTGSRLSDDTFQVPWIFRKPRQFANTPLLNQFTFFSWGSTGLTANGGALPPGAYTPIFTDSSTPAGDLTLKPGVYYTPQFEIGQTSKVLLSPQVTPTNPCVLYVGSMVIFEENCQINMLPAPGQAAPDPRRLQIYTTDSMYGYTYVTFMKDCKVCCTLAGHRAKVDMAEGAEFYGAVVADSINPTASALPNANVKIHYSRDLPGQELQGEPEWVLVDQGLQR